MVRGFGNLINRVQEESKQPIPTVGIPCTIIMYSDRHAAEVTKVSKSGKRIWVREMDAKAKHVGMTESQDWELTSNEKNPEHEFRISVRGRAKGTWRRTGHTDRLGLGYHDHHFDYSF